jgi:sRNA-binding protein
MENEPKKKSIVEEIREVRVDTIMNKAENATNQVSDGIVKQAEEKQKKKRKQRQNKKMEGVTESNPAETTDNNDSKLNGENDTSNVLNISKLDQTNTSVIQNTSVMDNSVVDTSMSAVGTDQKPKRVVPRKS